MKTPTIVIICIRHIFFYTFVSSQQMERAILQENEAKLWNFLFKGKNMSMSIEWLKKKKEHQEVYAVLNNLESSLVSENSSASSHPFEEKLKEIVELIMKEKKEGTGPVGKRPVVICEADPFVVYMNDEELTTFSLYKAKLRKVRPSMDSECWRHWTSVRSAFWRHQDIRAL